MVENNSKMIAVVIPCYKVSDHIFQVLAGIGDEVHVIFVVDDACPERSGALVEDACADPRVRVIYHWENQGVGAATLTGFLAAIEAGADVVVKVDGDGQMDPALIPDLVAPILAGEADYAKGNRFYDLEGLHVMPKVRLFGNAILSFMTKLSSGYWDIFDPTNGYIAIHADIVRHLPIEKISKRYFFETDMLFRLNVMRAVVVDVPMDARYGEEVSNLRISAVVGDFLAKHLRNFFKRIFYSYYLRDMSVASIELPAGVSLFLFGLVFGLSHWIESWRNGVPTTSGTVMLGALPVLMGLQLILAFLGYDIASVPHRPIHKAQRRTAYAGQKKSAPR